MVGGNQETLNVTSFVPTLTRCWDVEYIQAERQREADLAHDMVRQACEKTGSARERYVHLAKEAMWRFHFWRVMRVLAKDCRSWTVSSVAEGPNYTDAYVDLRSRHDKAAAAVSFDPTAKVPAVWVQGRDPDIEVDHMLRYLCGRVSELPGPPPSYAWHHVTPGREISFRPADTKHMTRGAAFTAHASAASSSSVPQRLAQKPRPTGPAGAPFVLSRGALRGVDDEGYVQLAVTVGLSAAAGAAVYHFMDKDLTKGAALGGLVGLVGFAFR